MEQIMQMQDDIHKLKKLMDSVFEKIDVVKGAIKRYRCENKTEIHPYGTADAYTDKDRIVELLNRLSSRMADADMSNLTAMPTKDATAEDIAELKQKINHIEDERKNINRRAGASLKGIL